MKNLYLVTLYNHRANQHMRVAASGDTEKTASDDASDYANDGEAVSYRREWKVRHTQYVCQTPDDTLLEV